MARAREVLRREQWEVLEVQLCDRLIESRVREQGGEMLVAYEAAMASGSAIQVFPNNFATGKSGIPTVLPVRITESFMDQVVVDAGGERIPTDDENRIVDYLIEDWLFELKDSPGRGAPASRAARETRATFRPVREARPASPN